LRANERKKLQAWGTGKGTCNRGEKMLESELFGGISWGESGILRGEESNLKHYIIGGKGGENH